MRRHPYLTTYLVLLALSTAVRSRGAWTDGRVRGEIWIAGRSGSNVVLLEGAADSWASNEEVLARLAAHRVVGVVPDGEDAASLLAGTEPPGVDVVAIGTAGPRGIALAAAHPSLVRSLSLIDATGIEEFDLLGDHNLNRLLRRTELVAIDLARAFVPHFGILDFATLHVEAYARAMAVTDRRGTRGELAVWNGPTEIFVRGGGRNALATAREHARLLPQSTLAAWHPDSLVAFLDRVDAGTAPTRATADPARIAAAALPFDAHGISSAEGSALYVVLLLLALTTLLSEDLACVTAGMLAARGSIPLLPAIIACYLGIILGDQLLYLLGRSAGRALVTRVPIKWILPPKRLDRAVEWFRTNGMNVVLTSRFLPGTRFPVYVAAGILRGGFVRFALWLMAIGALWTPALVGLSYEATRTGRATIEGLPGATWLWALGLILAGTMLLRLLVPLITAQGRREAAESLRKAARTGPKSPSE